MAHASQELALSLSRCRRLQRGMLGRQLGAAVLHQLCDVTLRQGRLPQVGCYLKEGGEEGAAAQPAYP